MTITREQVEAMRLRCTSEMVEYRLADQLDDMLRDLWQRVEEAEKDAARYRWLRESDEHLDEVLFVTMGDYAPVWRDDSEADIDARLLKVDGGSDSR